MLKKLVIFLGAAAAAAVVTGAIASRRRREDGQTPLFEMSVDGKSSPNSERFLTEWSVPDETVSPTVVVNGATEEIAAVG
jgi:hypothetical protein